VNTDKTYTHYVPSESLSMPINTFAAGAPPQTLLGSLQHS